MKTIFISVASYNEPYLDLMIKNCMENAEYPERVNFGIWCHNNDGHKPNFSEYKNITYACTDYQTMLGLGVGRLNSWSFYNKEDYCLQLDAHMLFEKHWDTKIIEYFELLKKEFEKPIISTYVPWWYMLDNKIQNYANDKYIPSYPMSINQELLLTEGYPKLTTTPMDWSNKKYQEHFFVTGHFIFSEPSILNDVMPDPKIIFAGDEITLALRLWTRGYRMFVINTPIVWHLNKGEDEKYKNKKTIFNADSKDVEMYYSKSRLGRERVRDILTGKLLGYWGSPDIKKLKEFEDVIGIDFKVFYKEYSGDEVHIGIV